MKPCRIPRLLRRTDGTSYGYINGNPDVSLVSLYSSRASDYGLTQDNTWGVTWSNGDKVVGEAICSAKSGDNHNYAWDGDSSDWTATESELTNASGAYCWCKVTGYMASGTSQCSLAPSSWLFLRLIGASSSSCIKTCARYCAQRTQCAYGANSCVEPPTTLYAPIRWALFEGVLADE